MKKEFNLSEHRGFAFDNLSCPIYPEDKVKEFIKRLKEELSGWKIQRGISDESCHKIIDKLAGEKLI